MLKTLIREPLVHFLCLGATLFLVNAWIGRTSTSTTGGEIVVGEARVRSLAQNFRRTWQRPPSQQELDGLVQEFIRDEVLYREGLSMGLDRDDAIIRRRVRQKVEFMFEETSALATPTDEQLAQYLATNKNAFRSEPRATFAQVFLDPRLHVNVQADARRLRDALNSGAMPASRKVGDVLPLLERRLENASKGEVEQRFGGEFATALFEQKTGHWVGPIPSAYGLHVVRVDSMTSAGVATVADVRQSVEREWANAGRKARGDSLYAQLREKYHVTIAPDVIVVGASQSAPR